MHIYIYIIALFAFLNVSVGGGVRGVWGVGELVGVPWGFGFAKAKPSKLTH